MNLVKSNFEILHAQNKKKEKKEKYEDVKNAILLSQGIIIGSIIISFIMSLFIPELGILSRIFFIILTFIMAISNYFIYKKISYSIMYLIVGIGFIVGTLLGV